MTKQRPPLGDILDDLARWYPAVFSLLVVILPIFAAAGVLVWIALEVLGR